MSRTVLFIVLLAHAALGADVRLRSVASAEPGLPVRLSDVASITGNDADRLGALVLIDDPGAELGTRRWITITPRDIVRAMEANAIAPSRHTINGRQVHVRVRTTETTAPRKVEQAEREHEVVALEGPETVRTRIAVTLAHRYGVTHDNLRLLFDRGNEALLGRELAGLTPVVRPVSSQLSERLRLEITLVQGERVVASAVVTGTAQIRREVALVTRHVERGRAITEDDIRVATRWMDPSAAARAVSPKNVVGQKATNRLDPQQVVEARDVEPPLAVKRGDMVIVTTVGGGVSIETKARVMRDARVGERVSCRLDRAGEPFEGVVTSPGRVLVNMDVRTVGTPDANGKTNTNGEPS